MMERINAIVVLLGIPTEQMPSRSGLGVSYHGRQSRIQNH